MRKALAALLAGVVMLGGLLPAMAAVQQSPSKGDTIQERRQPSDGRGVPFAEDHFIGYKVFEDSNSSTGVFIADEAGNNATSGTIYAVCVGQQTENTGTVEYAQVTETPVVFSGRQGGNLAPRVFPPTAAGPNTTFISPACVVVNAQFNNTVQVWNSGTDLDTIIYWRPSKGLTN